MSPGTAFDYPFQIHLKLQPGGVGEGRGCGLWVRVGGIDLSCNINSIFQFRYVLIVCNHPNSLPGKIKVPSLLWNRMQHEMSIFKDPSNTECFRTGPTYTSHESLQSFSEYTMNAATSNLEIEQVNRNP